MLGEVDSLEESWRRLRALGSQHLGQELGERVVSLARPAIRLVPGSGNGSAGGPSRLGGNPVLAPGTGWPTWADKPLSLLAVIDLAEVARLDDGGWLPTSGWLNFFYEAEEQQAWGFDPAHADGWRVVHTGADGIEAPPVAGALAFPAHAVQLSRIVTLPGWDEEIVADLSRAEHTRLAALDEEWRNHMGLGGEWPSGEPHHQLGGWPRLVQGPFWLEAQLASHGIYVGDLEGYRDGRAAVLRDGASSWRLLLQLDTDDTLGWMWGDVGRLFYAIREDDLTARDFTRSWMSFQCS